MLRTARAGEARVVARLTRGPGCGTGGHAMRRRLIAFDLDGTLAESKSPITVEMAIRLSSLLDLYQVCVISGGKFDQFKTQVIDRLQIGKEQMSNLHIMPTSGTKYLRFDGTSGSWTTIYSEELSGQTRAEVIGVLTQAARELGYWEANPFGDIIEDRGSQVTFSALGQEAPAEKKHAWDPDGTKKETLRQRVAAKLPDLEVHAGGTTSIDVTMKGVDKAYGMRKLMSVNDLESTDILFFGDKLEEGGNDYPVKTAGIDCIAVSSWEETAVAIEAITQVSETTPGGRL